MAFNGLLITEIFYSIQGETSHSGLPYTFIRLTGCNLRCSYCDSTYAFKGGTRMTIDEVAAEVKKYPTPHVLLTGGEPLLQRGTLPLAKALHDLGYEVSIETHGEAPITPYSEFCRIVMDIKTPGSQMSRGGWTKNLPHLKITDEIKFVITSEADYFWAKEWLTKNPQPFGRVLFSPIVAAKNSPGHVSGLSMQWLADQILKDHLPVRFQTQLHKAIWGAEKTGV
jgi:7-carboxy-7-deazaguanine synthase